MSETADTSTDTIRRHRQNQQSIHYNEQYPLDRDDLLRFDIPWDMTNKVGFRWVDYFKVIRDDNLLRFSVLPLSDNLTWSGGEQLYEYHTETMFSVKGGDPTSKMIFKGSDNVYTLLPIDFIPQWSHGDTVTYTYIHEEGGEERHLEVKRG